MKSINNLDLLQEQYLAIHEAAFLLYPECSKHNLIKTPIVYNSNSVVGDLGFNRQYIYLSNQNNPLIDDEGYNSIYNKLKEAIDQGELYCYNFRVRKDVVYFISPYDVVKWALLNGNIIPKSLEEALHLYSQDLTWLKLPGKTITSLPMKVKEKIIAQFLLANDPEQNRTDLCKRVLTIVDHRRTDLTAVRNNINELYDFPGRKGRKKKGAHDHSESYILKPIVKF